MGPFLWIRYGNIGSTQQVYCTMTDKGIILVGPVWSYWKLLGQEFITRREHLYFIHLFFDGSIFMDPLRKYR